MAAFTTIALATVAVGGAIYKGVQAGSAASAAATAAGDLRVQQAELEKEAIARLEQDFFEGVRANTDIYDKALEVSNVKGAELVQAAQEGDQRGIAATAGKVKEIEQAGLGALSDKFSKEKLEIDLNRAKANEMSASEIAAMQDDRAAAAGLRSDALMAQSDKLKGEATDNFIQAGVSAVTYGVDIATEISAGKDQAAIDKLVSSGKSLGEAQTIVADASKAARRDFMGGNANAFGTAPPPPPVVPDSGFNNVFDGVKNIDTSLYSQPNTNPFLNPSGMKNFFPGLDTKNIFNTDYTSMKNNQVYDDFMKTFEYQQGRGI